MIGVRPFKTTQPALVNCYVVPLAASCGSISMLVLRYITDMMQYNMSVCQLLWPFACHYRASGQSSQERKRGLIGKLLVASKGSEPGYIIRSLQVGLDGVQGCSIYTYHPCSAGAGSLLATINAMLL